MSMLRKTLQSKLRLGSERFCFPSEFFSQDSQLLKVRVEGLEVNLGSSRLSGGF